MMHLRNMALRRSLFLLASINFERNIIDGLRCRALVQHIYQKKEKKRNEKRTFQAPEQWEACASTRREAGCGEPLILIKININTPALYHFICRPWQFVGKGFGAGF